MWRFINDFLMENELFAQFVLLSGLKIYFFWQKYTSQTKYFFGSLSNRSPCNITVPCVKARYNSGPSKSQDLSNQNQQQQPHQNDRSPEPGPAK